MISRQNFTARRAHAARFVFDYRRRSVLVLGVIVGRKGRFPPRAIADHREGNRGPVFTDTLLAGKQQGMGNGFFSV
jgi:hypothetical protein